MSHDHHMTCFLGDVFLLNLRSDLSKLDSALLLHRRGYDCNFSIIPDSCSNIDEMVCGHTLSLFHSMSYFLQVDLKSLFTGTTVAKATEMYLSLLREKGPIKTADFKIDIPPMEIQTYSLSWL